MITKLKENQIFVFGSNALGHHYGGAAKQAYDDFGAKWGKAEGLSGQSWAIVTLDKDMNKVKLEFIGWQLEDLAKWAERYPDNEFLLTDIGCGIAGFKVEEIKSILPKFPPNVLLVGNLK